MVTEVTERLRPSSCNHPHLRTPTSAPKCRERALFAAFFSLESALHGSRAHRMVGLTTPLRCSGSAPETREGRETSPVNPPPSRRPLVRKLGDSEPKQPAAGVETLRTSGCVRTTCHAASDDRPTAPPPDPAAMPEGFAVSPSEALDVSRADQLRIEEMFASMPGMNHYQVLGVARDADKKSIKRAYCALMARWHPDRWFGKAMGGYGAKLDRIVHRINDAHEALTSRDGRVAYDESLPPPAPRRTEGVEDLVHEAVAEMHGATDAARHEALWSPRAPASEEQMAAAPLPLEAQPEEAVAEVGRATLPSADAVMVASSSARPSRDPMPAPRRRPRRALSAIVAFAAAAALPISFHHAPPRAHHAVVAAKSAPSAPSALAAPPPPVVAPAAVLATTQAPAALLAEAPAAAPTEAPASTTGKLRVTTAGRRVFVDRHIIGEGPRTFVVACGVHKVRVGSTGKTQTIDIPCDGEIVVGVR